MGIGDATFPRRYMMVMDDPKIRRTTVACGLRIHRGVYIVPIKKKSALDGIAIECRFSLHN